MSNTEVLRPYISYAEVPKSFGYTESVVNVNGKDVNALILEGEFQRANKPNKNNRVYEASLLRRETGRLQEQIKERNGVLCGMDHPIPNPNDPPEVQLQQIKRISLENACAVLTHLEMNGDVVYGKARVLTGDYGNGDKLAAMVRAGFKPGVSSRGIGGNPVMRNGFMYVPENYQMICFDFVQDPSTHNAILEQAFHEEAMLLEATLKRRKLYEVLIDLSNKYIS